MMLIQGNHNGSHFRRGTILNKVTFRSSFELLTPLDATLLCMWVLPSKVGDSVSSLRNCETQIADIKKRYHDSIAIM